MFVENILMRQRELRKRIKKMAYGEIRKSMRYENRSLTNVNERREKDGKNKRSMRKKRERVKRKRNMLKEANEIKMEKGEGKDKGI